MKKKKNNNKRYIHNIDEIKFQSNGKLVSFKVKFKSKIIYLNNSILQLNGK